MRTTGTGRLVALGALIGTVLVAGCGSSNGSPAGCLKFQPCGGDVVGTWNLLGACHSATLLSDLTTELQASCPGASVSVYDIDISGTITFNTDLTYASNVNEMLKVTETLPLACLGFASCAEVTSASAESTVTCTGTTTCTCHVVASPAGTETGTYTTSGTNLTIAGPNTNETDAYCVESGRLHLLGISDTSGAIIGDFVAQKQ